MRLGDADAQMSEAVALERVELLRRRRVVLNAVGPVDLGRNRFDLLPQGRRGRIKERERARLLSSLVHCFGEGGGAAASLGKVVANRRADFELFGDFADGSLLGGMVGWKGVDRNHRRHAVDTYVLDLLP